MGVLKLIFIALMLIFPLGEIARFTLANGVAITVNDILVALLIIVSLFYFLAMKTKVNNLYLRPFLLFAGIGFLSLLINSRNLSLPEFAVSFLYLLRWCFYGGILFMVSRLDNHFKKIIIYLMIFSGATIVLGGYIQYFFYNNLRNLYYLGWDDHLYRMFSSFLDPNFLGAFLVLYFLMLLAVLLQLVKNKNHKVIVLTGILLTLTLSALFLTYSRSALLMFAVGSTTLLILEGKKKWILAVFTCIAVVFFAFSKNFYIENINLLRTASSEARIDSSLNAMKIIRDNPLLGVGFNAYRYAQIRYGFREGVGARVSHADAGTDNSFLFTLATTGVVGLASYLYIWFLVIKNQLREYKRPGSSMISNLVIASIFGILVNSLFINSLFYPFIMQWLWILIGISVKENR